MRVEAMTDTTQRRPGIREKIIAAIDLLLVAALVYIVFAFLLLGHSRGGSEAAIRPSPTVEAIE